MKKGLLLGIGPAAATLAFTGSARHGEGIGGRSESTFCLETVVDRG